MAVTAKQVANIAHLARLQLAENEVNKYQQQLSKILDLVEQMKQVDTSNVAPMAHPLNVSQRLRADIVTETYQPELLDNAPAKEAGVFLVPAVLE